MNKKLLAAAVAAAVVAAPAAFAESVVYGKLHTSVDMNDVDYTKDNWSMESRASRLGFKGSEDLGNGLKAIYQAEFSVQTDGNDGGVGQDGGDGWGGQRNTFIGLSGGWGTFLIGRHDTPAKMAFYATGNERLGDSIMDLNLANGLNTVSLVGDSVSGDIDTAKTQFGGSGLAPIGVFSEYRADNAIAYVSPNFSGFSLAAAVVPGEDSGVAGTSNERDGIADHYSLGLMYKGGGLRVGAGYSLYAPGAATVPILTDTSTTPATVTSTPADDQTQLQIGASYTMGAFSIGGQYEQTDNYGFVENWDYDAWAVTGSFTMGNNVLSLVYTDGEADGLGITYERGGWGVSAEHKLSKRTSAYVAYVDGEEDLSALGESVSRDSSVFSLGMIHNF